MIGVLLVALMSLAFSTAAGLVWVRLIDREMRERNELAVPTTAEVALPLMLAREVRR